MPSARSVLHVYSGNLFGGVERMLIALAGLDAVDCRHHFALCFEGKLSRALQARGAPVEFLGPVRLRKPLSVLRARAALKRLLRARHFDAVVCHSIWAYCIFSSIVARVGGAPILFLHDVPDPKSWFYRWAWRSPPALCIANSAYTAKLLANLRSPVPVRIVQPLVYPPRAFGVTETENLRAQLGGKSGDVIVLHASRFDEGKGHRNLLRALHATRDLPTWRCWFAGAPQRPHEQALKQELLQMVDSLGIAERVSFIGHRDDMEAVLAACDVYCQPNEIAETFGMVFIEALYAGKPVVGSALGGTLEIVTPDCGLLCAPAAEPLAEALRRLLEDAQLRQQMSKSGPARAAQLCGLEQFCARFRAAIELASDTFAFQRRWGP
jgi:glycosyltransferase involved in cell wall biosynthesis